MQINKYGKLPKNSLICALGAMRETIIHTAYAPSPELCSKCSHLGDKHFNCAVSCPYKGQEIELEQTRYIYESKKTSSENRKLSLIGIKTLVYLHMITRNGGINDFDPEEVAQEMDCCPLSIKNALDKLQNKGYILYQKDNYSGLYTILIKNYTKDLNRTANQNGLGYITINKAFMSVLMTCKNITTARLLLRAYDMVYSNKHHANNITVYMKEFLKAFPEYVSKKLIINMLANLTDVLKFDAKRNRLSFYFSPEVNAEAAYTEERTTMQKHIMELITSMNKNIATYKNLLAAKIKKADKHKPSDKIHAELRETASKLQRLGFKDSTSRIEQNHLNELILTEKEIIDFTNIGMKYGISILDQALLKACEDTTEFTNPTGALKSRGAYLHAIAKELVYWHESSISNRTTLDYVIA